jgi:hypothetical protein
MRDETLGAKKDSMGAYRGPRSTLRVTLELFFSTGCSHSAPRLHSRTKACLVYSPWLG